MGNISPDVKWPSPQQWNSLRGAWKEMPDVVTVIDGTSQTTNRTIGSLLGSQTHALLSYNRHNIGK